MPSYHQSVFPQVEKYRGFPDTLAFLCQITRVETAVDNLELD